MKTASLFMNGRSQAVRLPAEFRFNADHVFIYRDELTGNVVLSDKPQTSTWQSFMALREQLGVTPSDFVLERNQSSEQRDPFDGYTE
jgi:antitoxin VapB